MRTICKCILVIFLILPVYSCSNKTASQPIELKVMSFNIWLGAKKSIPATAQVLIESKADIVGIQEANRDGKDMAVYLADSIGWYSYSSGGSPTIISRYPIVDTSASKNGVKIKIDESHSVWMFNVHLMYCPYEPYQLNGIEYCGGPILQTAEEAVESAIKSRSEAVNSVIADILEVQKEGYPIFLTGDFNEPSCLDWTAKAVEAGLCKIPVIWPSTKAFIDKGGMQDSYRLFYPDEVSKLGHTWTTLPEVEAYTEVLDRIDFVMFRGDKIKLINSQVVGEKSVKSDIGFDNYPSDHRAVLSTFTLE
ncbi:endonuclease/exonuclease/phosphatase family protein [Dysgonomonas sp. ZJ709]|uniref:endonuclease/exonuclease/phosphatase family protein n=1 Tax=Dysgonomonas sp. ZJ709 TaxID=2709797 RepID=UPI0013EAEEE7|nr:endonuclease/exonuclease/phosphatase family protein [Dysgonomonas sp. ZJ709]